MKTNFSILKLIFLFTSFDAISQINISNQAADSVVVFGKGKLMLALFTLSTGHVNSQIHSLSGEWQFRFDSVKELTKITLPGSCEEQGFEVKSTVKQCSC